MVFHMGLQKFIGKVKELRLVMDSKLETFIQFFGIESLALHNLWSLRFHEKFSN